MVVVLKLGGSVITRKGEPETLDRDSLDACARAIGTVDDDLVLVHGGGSFGHHHAARHGVDEAEGTDDAQELFDIHDAMRALNDHVVSTLHDHDVPAVGLHPRSLAHRDAARDLSMYTGALEIALSGAFAPVLFGDAIPHAGQGFTVVSGDDLVAALATTLEADRVGLCADVPGVRDAQGAVIDRITSMSAVADALGASDDVDVTGGMTGKVRALLDLPVPASIFGLEALPAFLAGEVVGTTVDGTERADGADEPG